MMNRLTCHLVLVLLVVWSTAVSVLHAQTPAAVPLTADQQAQLDSARDDYPDTDEGALYPLLENALSWPANVQAGAMLPDYDAIAKNPAAHRGQLFLIEGTLRQIRPVGRLALPGPWEGRITEWAVQYGDEPADMLIVNLVDAPADAREYKQVRLAARFYKLWPTTSKTGQARTFMVFVGHDAMIVGARPGVIGDASVVKSLVLVLCLLALGLFWVLKRTPRMSMTPQPTARQLQRRQARQQLEAQHAPGDANHDDDDDDDDLEDEADLPALPRDPAQALAAMDAHRRASKNESSD